MSTYATPATLALLKVPHVRKAARGNLVLVDTLKASVISHLKELLDVSDAEMSTLLGIPGRSYHRHKGSGEALKPAQADSTLRVGRVLQEARQVFGDAAKALRWLKSMHPVLAAAPIGLIGSDAGAQAVLDELMRVQWGDLA